MNPRAVEYFWRRYLPREDELADGIMLEGGTCPVGGTSERMIWSIVGSVARSVVCHFMTVLAAREGPTMLQCPQ